MMCVVQKEFTGAGEDFIRNELVDSAKFRNGDTLVQLRYLRPATELEIKQARLVGDTPRESTPVRKTTGLKVKVKRS